MEFPYPRLLETTKEQYGRVCYSHKVHEKQAELLSNRIGWLRGCQVASTVLATSSAVVVILGDNRFASVLTAVFAAIALLLEISALRFSFDEMLERHRRTAIALWVARERLINLMTDAMDYTISIDAFKSVRDEVTKQLENIYSSAPQTGPKALAMASFALKVRNEQSFTSEELDNLLPGYLRGEATVAQTEPRS